MLTTIAYATHTAHLDPMTGVGVLVMPSPDDDMSDPLGGVATLHAAGWDAAVRDLGARGWEPLADEWDLPMVDGTTADGRTVVALYGRESIVSDPDMGELANAQRELHVLAGLA
ncbi:hypothetical protein ACF049_00470 [Cellulosimicrobium funkei]|uniref:hypothetical protein n=1 Tax=Cellulosimicrobium funkei TaxID=264251 RepID=UPI0036F9C829